MNFNFGEVLTRAWQITWKYKVLWIFGILASCSGGRANSGGSSNSRWTNGSGNGNGFGANDPFSSRMIEEAGRWIAQHWWVIALIILAVIILVILSIFLGTIGKIGLIKGTFKAEQGAESMSFGELWSQSQPYFWRVFGLSFLIGLIFLAIFLVIFLPLALLGVLTAGMAFLCIIPLVCILIPISWVVAIVLEQANIAIVLEDKSMFDGFKRGWEVCKNNIGPVIIMTLILGIGGAIIGIIIALPIIIIAFSAAFGFIAGGITTAGSKIALVIALACCVVYFPVLLILNGVLTTYVQSAWTLTFMRLTKPQENNTPIIVEGNAQ